MSTEKPIRHQSWIDLLRKGWQSLFVKLPSLKRQENEYDHPGLVYMFQPSPEKPFLSTPGAIEVYQADSILACLIFLQLKTKKHQGLDYFQVFEDQERSENLWYIEDGDAEAITVLFPSEY